MFARLAERPLLVALLLGLAAQALFTFHLDRPSIIMFDEVHYVPAARALLALGAPLNTEHPLLGKELIAAGIALFGDNPIGWRILSTLAGTATVLAGYAIVWLLVGQVRAAAFAGVFVAINHSVFIQARIAMLDGFLAAFVTLGIAALLWEMRAPPGRGLPRLLLASVLLGLAVAVKWTAAPYVALAGIALIADRWSAPKATRSSIWIALPILGVVSVFTYFLTFAPAFFYTQVPLTLDDLLPMQLRMYEAQTQVLHPHPYQSDWWSWPLLIRPIWYFYEPDQGNVRGVLMLGNPLLMWGGLLAVVACWAAWFRERSRAALVAAGLWTFSLAIWALIPKSLGFYYYYHLSAIFVCVAIAVAMHHYRAKLAVWDEWFAFAALVSFVYFYPILSAAPLANKQAFNHWMWFASWR
jgi:dolichyl-phosphate-mannose--protein O-mannosyl transferase